MKKSTKFLWVLTAGLIVAGVPTGFALHYKKDIGNLEDSQGQYEQQLKDKDLALDEANSKIDELEEQINDINSQSKICSVKFDLQGEIIEAEPVLSGESVTFIPSVPSSKVNQVEVFAWKLSDGTLVDPLTYVVNENTIFYADYALKYCYRIDNVLDSTTAAGTYVYRTSLQVPTTSSYAHLGLVSPEWEFQGYYVAGKLYSPGEICYFVGVEDNTKVTSVIPIYKKSLTATFKVGEVEYSMQNFARYNSSKYGAISAKVDITTLETPTKEGYTFKGWAIEGAEDTIIDLATYIFQDNVTFVAVFE